MNSNQSGFFGQASATVTPTPGGSPLVYTIDAACGRVYVTYIGQPTFALWVRTMGEIFRHPDYQYHFGIVLDRRSLGSAARSDFVHHMVYFIDQRVAETGTGRWALLAGGPAAFGMARMAELMSESKGIRAFQDLDKAEEWLAGIE